MNADFVVALMQETLRTILYVGSPIVLGAMAVGLVVSVLQAATQIQEMTLVFVPKIGAAFLALLLFAAFMLDTLARFTIMIFDLIVRVGQL